MKDIITSLIEELNSNMKAMEIENELLQSAADNDLVEAVNKTEKIILQLKEIVNTTLMSI